VGDTLYFASDVDFGYTHPEPRSRPPTSPPSAWKPGPQGSGRSSRLTLATAPSAYRKRNANRRARRRGAPKGWEFVHVCVDDATRLAYVEVLADE
jgi:hypothetical protein